MSVCALERERENYQACLNERVESSSWMCSVVWTEPAEPASQWELKRVEARPGQKLCLTQLTAKI